MLTAERTYKLESGPPPLTWERYSELVRRDWRDLLDSAEHHDEAIFQKFLETHPCMVSGGQSMSGPSGHSAVPAAMITQPSLPGFSEHIPDFLWIATDSLHIYAVLVEIESPKKKMFTKGGQPTAQFTQAQNQIAHWKSWFRDASNQRLFCEHYLMDGLPSNRRYAIPHARNLPLPVISHRPRSKTIRRAACGVTSSVFATIFADTSGLPMTSTTSSGSSGEVRRPSSFHANRCVP